MTRTTTDAIERAAQELMNDDFVVRVVKRDRELVLEVEIPRRHAHATADTMYENLQENSRFPFTVEMRGPSQYEVSFDTPHPDGIQAHDNAYIGAAETISSVSADFHAVAADAHGVAVEWPASDYAVDEMRDLISTALPNHVSFDFEPLDGAGEGHYQYYVTNIEEP